VVSSSVSGRRTTVQTTALLYSIVFALVGLLGFIPGVTTHYKEMEFAGHHSGALLLGVFAVSFLHNIVHLFFGVWGLVASRTWAGSRTFLIGGGAIYLVLWLYGLVVHQGSSANFVPVNGADNWLHLLLGVSMVALGLLLTRRRPVVG
jgi:hypothetical protein